MNFIRRGIASIVRKPGKTIILLLIVFILGNIIAGAISIGQAVNNTEENLKKNITAAATVEWDYTEYEKYYEEYGDYPEYGNISADVYREIGELSYVKYYDYSAYAGLYSRDMTNYSDPDSEYAQEFVWAPTEGLTNFSLTGVQDPEILAVKENKIGIVSGRAFTEQEVNNLSYVAVISQELAGANNLSVGSKFTMETILYNDSGEEAVSETDYYADENIFASQSYEFEVVGIFEVITAPTTSGDEWDTAYQLYNLQNKIYVPNKVVEAVSVFEMEQYALLYPDDYEDVDADSWVWYENVYVLGDASEIDQFKEEVEGIVPEFYKVSSTTDTYSDVAAPMESLGWLSSVVLWVAVGATLIILSLLITLFLRDRKKEIGIYLALGEKKSKVISQIVLEVAAISIVGITLSLFSGNILSNSISKTMLQNDIVAQQEEDDSANYYEYTALDSMGYSSDITGDDIIDSYSVSLDAATVLLFYAVGIGTVVVSTVVPIIYIVRLNPKKILM